MKRNKDPRRSIGRKRGVSFLLSLTWLGFVLGAKQSLKDKRARYSFDLHPVGLLLEEQRRRRLSSSGNSTRYSYPSHWFNHSAVYATIPDPDDVSYREHRQLRHFHRSRHLSRYELQYRSRNGLDLQLDWDGSYSDDVTVGVDLFNMSLRETQRGLSSSSSIAGGQFNNYQAVPLSQGYGTHFANVWVGSPVPQRKTVIVDTGSHYTAFPCTGCRGCGAPHHTDPYFSPSRSTSFHTLQCDECKDGVVCSEGQCKFSQAYTEGSTWEAIQVQDKFYCGGSDVLDSAEPMDEKYAITFMFGCQTSMTGLFITQLADGIMGMSAHPATLPKKLFDARLIEHNVFSMCFRRELGTSKRGVTAGSMTIGGISNNLDTSPMIYAKNIARVGWFTVYVKGVYIRTGGGQSAKSSSPDQVTHKVKINPSSLNSGKGVIVDSGTTDTYLSKQIAAEFNKAWKKATGQAYSHSTISLTQEQLLELPTILIQCQAYSHQMDPAVDDYDSIAGYTGSLDPDSPNDLLIAIPATSYMDYSPITKKYMSRLYFTETAGGVLGSNTMQGHNVVFDWEHGRVGFAESSCAYDKKNAPKIAQDEGFSSDCVLGDTILSTACVDTLQTDVCRDNPTNIAVLGTETWTALVESPGTGSGISCFDAANKATSRMMIEDPVLHCRGDGVCEETRPCQMTCSQIKEAKLVKPVDDPERKCGDTGWSECDYGCLQSRITTVLYSDGHCRVKNREIRPCHIGACARADPCRVPFIIHAVLAMRGLWPSQWSLETEDLFATAITDAANRFVPNLFGPGDVNIKTVLPWYIEDGSPDFSIGDDFIAFDDAEMLGLRVIVEVYLYNEQVDNVTKAKLDTAGLEELSSEDRLANIFRNISDMLQGRQATAECAPDELFVLAKRAIQLKNEVFRNDLFIPTLIEEINMADPTKTLLKNTTIVADSRLLSLWSIRTHIDEEINYFGPRRPVWVKLLDILHQLTLALTFCLIFMSVWSCMVSSFDYISPYLNAGTFVAFFTWRTRDVPWDQDGNEDVNDLENSILLGPGDMEMTFQSKESNIYKLTSPKKRATTTRFGQSGH